MLRCNELTRLYASDGIGQASLRVRMAARIHLIVCRSCRRYVRELAAIGHAARGLAQGNADEAERSDVLIQSVLQHPPPKEP